MLTKRKKIIYSGMDADQAKSKNFLNSSMK